MDKNAVYYLNDSNIVAFPKLGLEFNIDWTAFTIFGYEIRWYGVIIAIGMLLAMVYAFRRMKSFGLDSDRAIDVVLCGLVGAILGARLYYVLFDADVTIADFFRIRDGGLAIYGGLIGALLVGAVVAKIRKVKIYPFLDIASLGFLIGQGIGRWGNFVNKEAFGSQTDLPWGMASATVQSTLGSAYTDVRLAHPCFLYESLWCFLGFALLHFYSKKRKFDGEIFLMYSMWYGLGRFFIEGLRMDSLYLGRLRVSQLLAAICVVVALALWIIIRGRVNREGTVLYTDTEESKQLLLEAEERAKASSKKSKQNIDSVSTGSEMDETPIATEVIEEPDTAQMNEEAESNSEVQIVEDTQEFASEDRSEDKGEMQDGESN